jgi:hypothetical protein
MWRGHEFALADMRDGVGPHAVNDLCEAIFKMSKSG